MLLQRGIVPMRIMPSALRVRRADYMSSDHHLFARCAALAADDGRDGALRASAASSFEFYERAFTQKQR